ncbi:MAG: hypothetical protein IPL50_17060 [Chitinophagaceae bacterium]|nr:hypothetical protein [Chitinophagaceae bacterium]
MSYNIADIRKDYQMQSLLETDVAQDPFDQFANWWDDAMKSELDEINAMTLATASATGMPAARIVLWASPQSSVIASREVIETNITMIEQQFTEGEISRPPHWGGYVVIPEVIEFWQGRPSRLHDRIQYSKMAAGSWKVERLAP